MAVRYPGGSSFGGMIGSCSTSGTFFSSPALSLLSGWFGLARLRFIRFRRFRRKPKEGARIFFLPFFVFFFLAGLPLLYPATAPSSFTESATGSDFYRSTSILNQPFILGPDHRDFVSQHSFYGFEVVYVLLAGQRKRSAGFACPGSCLLYTSDAADDSSVV